MIIFVFTVESEVSGSFLRGRHNQAKWKRGALIQFEGVARRCTREPFLLTIDAAGRPTPLFLTRSSTSGRATCALDPRQLS
jgi:hypothetical protein